MKLRGEFSPSLAVLIALVAVLVFAPAAMAKDRDKDGLPDKWETGKNPQGMSLKALHANPKHKDVFVELNYSKQTSAQEVSCGSLDALVKAYKDAPVSNPDGKGGITLHIDAGRKCGSSKRYDLGGSSRFKVKNACASPLDWSNVLARKRWNVFHIGAVVADSELCGAEGQEVSGNFQVKINGGGSFFSYVVMHELGHAFGLDHGNPNSFSVMSGGAYSYPDAQQLLTYTNYRIKPLDETSLDEHAGYTTGTTKGDKWLHGLYAPQYCGGSLTFDGRATGPVDWDCDGAPFYVPPYDQYIDTDPVSYDIDNNGSIGTVPGAPASWPVVLRHLDDGKIGNAKP